MDISFHIDSTAEVFDLAIDRLQSAALELERLKTSMLTKQDITYASEAITVIVNLPQSCRTDLFAVRPMRALNIN